MSDPDPGEGLSDKQKKCVDCGAWFLFSVREQVYFQTHETREGKPFQEPRRCKPCREAKKQARRSQGG